MDGIMDGYILLAAAVVRQAAEDYRDLLIRAEYLRRNNMSLRTKVRVDSDDDCRPLIDRIKELEDFFYDDSNLLLRGIDGGAVVEKIRDSVAKGEPITFYTRIF